MRLLFLGTGAADWPNPGAHSNGGRRFSSLLLDDAILIDFNAMSMDAVREFHVDVDKITDIVISHPHDDHFNMKAIEELAMQREASLPPLVVHVNTKAIERSQPSPEASGRLQLAGYLPGDSFECNGYAFESYAANHALEVPGELSAHLVVTCPSGERLFYTLDGSWFPSRTWGCLRKATPVDAVVWEMTCGTLYDWRVGEHCNLDMIACEAKFLTTFGFLKPGIPMFCSHIMRGACGDMEQLRKDVNEAGFIVAEDGMRFTTTP